MALLCLSLIAVVAVVFIHFSFLAGFCHPPKMTRKVTNVIQLWFFFFFRVYHSSRNTLIYSHNRNIPWKRQFIWIDPHTHERGHGECHIQNRFVEVFTVVVHVVLFIFFVMLNFVLFGASPIEIRHTQFFFFSWHWLAKS